MTNDELTARSRYVWQSASLKNCERVELLCLLLGQKPLVRLAADDSTAGEFSQLADRMGLCHAPSRVRQAPIQTTEGEVYTETVEWDDPRGRWFSYFIASDETQVEHAIGLEAAGADSETQGLLLGYPICCVEAYRRMRSGDDWLVSVLDLHPIDAPVPALANPLARLFTGGGFLPDYFPCSLSCPEALRLGHTAWDALITFGEQKRAAEMLQSASLPMLRAGRKGLIQLDSVRRRECEIEFDPRTVQSLHPLSDDLNLFLKSGRLSLDVIYADRKLQLIEFSTSLNS